MAFKNEEELQAFTAWAQEEMQRAAQYARDSDLIHEEIVGRAVWTLPHRVFIGHVRPKSDKTCRPITSTRSWPRPPGMPPAISPIDGSSSVRTSKNWGRPTRAIRKVRRTGVLLPPNCARRPKRFTRSRTTPCCGSRLAGIWSPATMTQARRQLLDSLDVNLLVNAINGEPVAAHESPFDGHHRALNATPDETPVPRLLPDLAVL